MVCRSESLLHKVPLLIARSWPDSKWDLCRLAPLADRGYDSNAIVEQAENREWKLLSCQKRIEKYKDLTINNCIS